MPQEIPTEQEVLGYFNTLSNWGRWGADDQMGTLFKVLAIGPRASDPPAGFVSEEASIS